MERARKCGGQKIFNGDSKVGGFRKQYTMEREVGKKLHNVNKGTKR